MIVVLYNRTDSLLVQMKGYLKRESGCLHFVLARGARGKISVQPHTTNNDKNNTLPLGKQICFTIVWGCAEILPSDLSELSYCGDLWSVER